MSDETYSAYIGDEQLRDRLDAYLAEYDGSESAAIRELLAEGVEARDADMGTLMREGSVQIEVQLSTMEARIIGNRLWKAAQTYDDVHINNETEWLARRFHRAAGMR